MRTHYAEADNELHHLLIMEALGGNENGLDRALAQTMAFVYYWCGWAGTHTHTHARALTHSQTATDTHTDTPSATLARTRVCVGMWSSSTQCPSRRPTT